MTTPPTTAADLTVVIPTLGRPILEGALHSIAAGTVLPAEVIVLDQGGTADTAEVVAAARRKGLTIRHITSTRRGVAAARNDGLALVSTPFVALTDDDCRVDTRWLEQLQAHLARDPDAIVTGQVRPDGDEPVPGTVTRPDPVRYARRRVKADPLFPDNMGAAMALVDRVGQFDESPGLRHAEDNDWSYRALKAGIPIDYDPTVIVTHIAWRDVEARAETYRRYARSQGHFYAKHLRSLDPFILLRTVFDLARGPWMWLRGRLGGDADLTAYGRAYMTELPSGLARGLMRR